MSTFDNQSMSIGCVGKLGHLFGFLRHYLLIFKSGTSINFIPTLISQMNQASLKYTHTLNLCLSPKKKKKMQLDVGNEPYLSKQ